MTIDETAVGRTGVLTVTVDEALTADAYGNTGLAVLATPALVGLCEEAAMRGLAEFLDEGERSVGTVIELEHLAPTPIRDSVTLHAEITQVEGAKVWFRLSASDSSGSIATGRHARFVVDDTRFRSRLERHPGVAGSSA